MTLDSLAKLADDDLRAVIARSEELLKERDTERKEKALSDARALLAAVGLSLKDLNRKNTKSKSTVYHAGRRYRHPANKDLVWSGKGNSPAWLKALEREGGSAIEVENEVVPQKRSTNEPK